MADSGPMSILDDVPSEENILLERLHAIEDGPSGNFAVYVHLSQLKAANRKPHYMRIASRPFNTLVANGYVSVYNMANLDLVIFCKEAPVDEVDNAIYKVRALFAEDPLTAGEDGSIDDRFATWYDLSAKEDFIAFKAVVEELEVEAARIREKRREAVGESPNQMEGMMLDPGNLVRIRDKLNDTRINDIIHRQSCVLVKPGAKGKILFREHYVSMIDLQQRVAPDVNLFGSLWLFQFLTETLDRRMLSIFGRNDFSQLGEEDAISLNLNVSTVLSRDFQEFNRAVDDHSDKVIVELQMIDIFADMNAFAYGRDMLQERGYRVLIDGLTPLSLEFFDPGLLKGDFVKVNWGREFKTDHSKIRQAELREMVNHAGRDRVILSRTDSEDAVKWALGLGIQRFQGRYVDKLVNAMIAKGIL